MNHGAALEARPWRSYVLEFGQVVDRWALDRTTSDLCQRNQVHDLTEVSHRVVQFDFRESRFIGSDAALWLLNILRQLSLSGNTLQLLLPEVQIFSESSFWDNLIRWNFFEAVGRVAGPASSFLSADQLRMLAARSSCTYTRPRPDELGNLLPVATHRLLAISGLYINRYEPIRPQLETFVWPQRDEILLSVLAKHCGISQDNAGSLISFIAEEAVRNAILHAGGDYALCSMQIIDGEFAHRLGTESVLRIAISDNGRGIPNVLRQAIDEGIISRAGVPADEASLINYFTSRRLSVDTAVLHAEDKAMIRVAAEPGIRGTLTTKGMGLHFLLKAATQLSGRVSIRSGHGEVEFQDGAPTHQSNDYGQALGTLVVVDLPILR